jgi:hypothetical protein
MTAVSLRPGRNRDLDCFRFSLNREDDPDSYLVAFSSREPASTSLEHALSTAALH